MDRVSTGDAKHSPGRIWRFAGCEFNERRRKLRVGDTLVDIEVKPLEVLDIELASELCFGLGTPGPVRVLNPEGLSRGVDLPADVSAVLFERCEAFCRRCDAIAQEFVDGNSGNFVEGIVLRLS